MRALPRRIPRLCAVVSLTAALVFAVADTADAQRIRRPPKSDFHVGQKVTFDFMGKCSGRARSWPSRGPAGSRFNSKTTATTAIGFPPDQVAVKPPPVAKTPMAPGPIAAVNSRLMPVSCRSKMEK